MEKATHKVLEVLRERGYRITGARKEIVHALAQSKSPLTIQALAERVKADEASVYRTIDLLEKEGLTEQIEVQNDATHYALADEHHHHIVCTNCDRIFHVACSQPPHVPRAFQKRIYITHHEVTFYGVCTHCCE